MFSVPAAARDRYDAVTASADALLVVVDFDGTLAPIVADPAAARLPQEAAPVLTALARRVAVVAILTGRPVGHVLDAGVAAVAESIAADAGRILVLGQYGAEQWSSDLGTTATAATPPGLAAYRAELPGLLEAAGAADAWVEDKGPAVAVHTRRTPDPQAGLDRLTPLLAAAARRHGLALEPGRFVLEARAPGSDKGTAVRALVDRVRPGAVVVIGDDLGDLPAFDAVAALREQGIPGLIVWSGSSERVAPACDLIVDGPPGVLAFLDRLGRGAAT
jgi:trehalose 6-phosphate phosphatase